MMVCAASIREQKQNLHAETECGAPAEKEKSAGLKTGDYKGEELR